MTHLVDHLTLGLPLARVPLDEVREYRAHAPAPGRKTPDVRQDDWVRVLGCTCYRGHHNGLVGRADHDNPDVEKKHGLQRVEFISYDDGCCEATSWERADESADAPKELAIVTVPSQCHGHPHVPGEDADQDQEPPTCGRPGCITHSCGLISHVDLPCQDPAPDACDNCSGVDPATCLTHQPPKPAVKRADLHDAVLTALAHHTACPGPDGCGCDVDTELLEKTAREVVTGVVGVLRNAGVGVEERVGDAWDVAPTLADEPPATHERPHLTRTAYGMECHCTCVLCYDHQTNDMDTVCRCPECECAASHHGPQAPLRSGQVPF